MSERDQAWASEQWKDAPSFDAVTEVVANRELVGAYAVDDLAHDAAVIGYLDGFNAGHAAAEAKYAPALSAAEAERDLARRNGKANG